MLFRRKISTEEFEAVALPHLDELFRTARRVMGNQTDSEDLIQEVYLQAWKSFHRFTPGTNCRAWLFKIMFHVVSHHRSRWFNSRRVEESKTTLEETLAYAPSVNQYLTDEDVLTAFEKIPEVYREVALLADVQDFSYKEIAEILSVPIGTVMSRLSRARKMLRTELAEFAQGYGIRDAGDMREGA